MSIKGKTRKAKKHQTVNKKDKTKKNDCGKLSANTYNQFEKEYEKSIKYKSKKKNRFVSIILSKSLTNHRLFERF